jgi:glyoxylase-like metal-dependent hydrolase (beta-lactamase superfamily II)
MKRPNEDCEYQKIHSIDGYLSRIFLVEYPHGLLLLDGCSICDVKRIEAFCTQNLKRDPTDIKLVVVSHAHPDHAGGVRTLREKYGVRIAGHPLLPRWYAGFTGWLQYRFDLAMMHNLVAKKIHRKFEPTAFSRVVRPDFFVDEGDLLPIFPDWRVLHVPGHTRHDISLYHEKTDVLYASDLIVDMNGGHNIPLPVVFPEMMRRSYEKVAGLNASTILLPHGRTIRSQNSAQVFVDMKRLLDDSPTPVRRFVDLFSKLTPDVWMASLKKKLSRLYSGCSP